MRKLALMFLISGTLMLQGCGFHLRGKVQLPEVLAEVHVIGEDFDMVKDFEDILGFNGARIIQDSAAANSNMVVETEYRREVRTVDARGYARSYNLVYLVRVTLLDQQGEQVYQSKVIRQQRNFNYNADQVLEQEDEEEFLKGEMRREIAQRVITILGRADIS